MNDSSIIILCSNYSPIYSSAKWHCFNYINSKIDKGRGGGKKSYLYVINAQGDKLVQNKSYILIQQCASSHVFCRELAVNQR